MPQDRERRFSLADVALVVALLPVVLLPELVGGVHPQIATGAALVEIVALGLVVLERALIRGPLRVSVVGLPLALGLIATLAECAPLPRGLVHLLQPMGSENASWVTALLGEEARHIVRSVLSLDPPETAFAAVRLAGALALFIVVTETCRHHRGRALAFRFLLASGLLMFVVALGHQLLHINGAWGRYTMKTAFFYAPIVNPNQLARVFGALSLVAGARALAVRTRVESLWFAVGAVCCGAGVFLTLSRGAMLAWFVGGVLLLFLIWRERRDPEQGADGGRMATLAVAQIGLVAALALGLFLARETIVKEAASLETENVETSKLRLYRPALSLLDDYGRVGVGNNAFGVAFMQRAEADLFGGGLTFTHPENIIIGTLVEHGVVMGGLILVAALAVGALLLVSLRSRNAFTPLPALGFLLLGDLFDFALESSAALYVAAVLLGLAASVLVEERSFRISLRGPAAPALVAVMLIVVVGAAPAAIGEWRRTLDARIDGSKGTERVARIEQALAAHPADAQYCYLLAVEARGKRDAPLALKWANRALVLWPTLRGAHIEAARALAALGRLDQALVEYKVAFADGAPDMHLVDEIAQRTPDLDKRRAALPDTPPALALLAERLINEKRLDDAQAILDAGALRRRGVEVALMRNDAAGAEARLKPLLTPPRVDPGDVRLALSAATVLRGAEAAYGESDGWMKRVVDDRPLLQWKLQTALALGKLDDASALIGRLRQRAGDAATVAGLDRQEADLYGRRGDTGRQLRILERLATRSPTDVALQIGVARMELSLGLVPQAKATWGRIPGSAKTSADVTKLKGEIDAAEQGVREDRMRGLVGPPSTAPTAPHGSSTR